MYSARNLHHILRPRTFIVAARIQIYSRLERTYQLSLSHRRNLSTKKDASTDKLIKPQQGTNPTSRGGSLSIGILTATCMGVLWFNNWCMSLDESPLSKALHWDYHVKSRIDNTYSYLGASVIISALFSSVLLMSSTVIGAIVRYPILTATASYSLAVGSHEYLKRVEESFTKKIAWIGSCASLSPFIIACSRLVGPSVLRAYLYALCMLGSLSITAMSAPSTSVFRSTAPLSVALGVICGSSIGSRYILTPSTYLLFNTSGIAITSGLALFSISLLRDRTLETAEEHPLITNNPYDPIKAAVHIYMDKLNIIGLFPINDGKS